MKKNIALILFLLCGVQLQASQNHTITAEAPKTVVKGDQFRVTFTVNTSENVKDFRGFSTLQGFNVIFGPSTSRSSSTQIINGTTTTSSSITFTYTLEATTEGTFSIPAATVVVNDEKLISNSLKIEVLPPDSRPSQSTQTTQKQQQANTATVSNDDLFVRVIASRTNVYEQEAFLLTYKIYYSVSLRGFENANLPDFNGFHSQEIEVSQSASNSLEHYNGRNYYTAILKQYLLFPQRSGTIEIAPARFDAVVAQQVRTNDPFDAFFRGSSYVTVKKSLSTPLLKINVKPLPTPRPDNFIGAVGSFNLESTITKEEVNADDAVTYKLILSGVGNLKLVNAPELQFPADFEVYDPKVSENVVMKSSGMSGNKIFEYLVIPRHPGKYEIPSLNLSYFDTKSGTYKKLATRAFTLNVGKSANGTSQASATADYGNVHKEDVKLLASDIKHIKLGNANYKSRDSFVAGSLGYALLHILPSILFIALFCIYRQNLNESMNIAKYRNRKANKILKKRMKKASALITSNNHDLFYDEVLKALWGYMADKLNINTSELNRDNIKEKMAHAGLQDQDIEKFISVLDECEFVRYAPSGKAEGMADIYDKAKEAILNIENNIRK